MDKLRKIVERLWRNKERIFLVAMLCILCWNVYKVLNTPEEKPTPHAPPKAQIDDTYQPKEIPEDPPRREVLDWTAIYTPNPFWYSPSQGGTAPTPGGEEDPGITLLRIAETGGRLRAQLRTASATRWYDENEAFESFQLLRIDPANRSVEVRSERLGRVITLKLPGE